MVVAWEVSPGLSLLNLLSHHVSNQAVVPQEVLALGEKAQSQMNQGSRRTEAVRPWSPRRGDALGR